MNNCDSLKIWELETRIKELEGRDLDNLISQFNDNIDKITNKACDKLDDIRPKQKKAHHEPTVNEMNRQLLMGALADSARRQAAACDIANQSAGLQDYCRQAGSVGLLAGTLGASLFT